MKQDEKTLDEIVKEFWQQVANSPEGEMPYDFSIREHRQVYYNRLDVDLCEKEAGADVIALAMDRDAEEKQRKCSGGNMEGFQDRYLITPMIEKNDGNNLRKNGRRADAGSRQVGNLQSASYMENKEGMMINVELFDKNYPENAFFSNSGICCNGNSIDLEAFLLSVTPQGRLLNEYETRCTFSNWSRSEESGEMVLSAVAKYCADSYAPAQNIVESIDVQAPVKWQSQKGDDTIVCYNRTTESGEANPDYVYPEVVVNKKQEPKKITVHLPFKGEIAMHVERDGSGRAVSGTIVQSVDTQSFKMSVSPWDESVGGETAFDKAGQKEKLDKLFYFDEEDKVEVTGENNRTITGYTKVKWELDRGGSNRDFSYHNWGKELLASHVTNDTHVVFHALIQLNVFNIDFRQPLQPVRVLIQSDNGTTPGGNVQNIPRIWLWWGCVSGDTRIRMAGEKEKPICEIKSGDMVLGTDGIPVRVQSVFSGKEERVIRLETEAGKSLLASEDHPVMSGRGMVRAGELTAGDQVQTIDGMEAIRTLNLVEYDGIVYNLEFSEKTGIYANGIVSGDMLAQQHSGRPVKKEDGMDSVWLDEPDPLTLELIRRIRRKKPCMGESRKWNLPARYYYGCPFRAEEEQNARVLGIRKDLFRNGFTLDVWVYITGTAEEILSQKDGFCLGVKENALVFSHPETDRLCVGNVEITGRWTYLSVSFAPGYPSKLTLGINGNILCELQTEQATLINDEDLLLGKFLDGYIRRVVLYDRSMPTEFLRSCMFRNVYNRNRRNKRYFRNILAFLDFNGTELADRGPRQYQVRGQNFCTPGSLVSCYLPAQGSCAFAPACENINPGGFPGGEFGIYIKFYYKEQFGKEAVLLSNGGFRSKDSMSLYLEDTPGSGGRIHLTLGEEDYILAEKISAEQWIDLTVSCRAKDGHTKAYINGEAVFEEETKAFARLKPGGVRIGNADASDSQDHTCSCYFWEAAVFDSALDEEKARQFYQTPPYVFEKNLKGLYFFGSGCPAELVSQTVLELRQEDISVQEDVIFGEETTPYFCDIDIEIPEGSQPARAFFKMFSRYLKKRFGLHIDSLDSRTYRTALYWIDKLLAELPQEYLITGEGTAEKSENESFHQALEKITVPWLTVFAELTHMNDLENKMKGEKEDFTGIADVAASVQAIVETLTR